MLPKMNNMYDRGGSHGAEWTHNDGTTYVLLSQKDSD